MELSAKTEKGRQQNRSSSTLNSNRMPSLSLILSVGVLCLKVLSIQAVAIQFTKEPKSQDALHGRSAMLRCEVSDPADVVYGWLHNGQPLGDTERRFREASNLKFTAVDRQLDAGNFECVATNTVTGDELHSTNASFNIKWLESGGVTLKDPPSEAEIESSAPVTLRCHIDGHPRPTCQWFRDGVRLTEKSHLINNKERTLTLRSVSPDDNALYYCCAKNAAGHVCSNANFTLNIIDKSFPQPVVAPDDQVVLKNEEAVFHCQFTAIPQPTLEWYHDDELLANKSRVILHSNGTLIITQVKPRNTGIYKCVGRGPRGTEVTLEASLLIAELEEMEPRLSRVFTADTLQRVACRPPRGMPPPKVWWERAGEHVPSEGRVYQEGLELVFSPTQEGDSGSYTCVAENKAARRTQEVSFTIATAPVWVTKPQDSYLEEGKPGYLHCHAQATPEPEVTWVRNIIVITPEDSRFLVYPNGTLRLNSVEVYDGQMYSCETKTEGGRLSGHARVIVLEKLKFTPTPQPAQCLELDNESNIGCSATGREAPTIRWTREDGGELPPHVEQRNGQLHFTKVTRGDAGNYTCIASNSLQGEIRAVVSLTVAVYISFRLEPEYTTVYQGHTTVLHCQASGDPEPHIQWMVKDKVLDSSKNRRFQKMANGSLVITDVTTDDTGKYTCVAGNSCSIKDRVGQLYVVEKPVQAPMDQEEKAPYKMIQTIGLSVGAAVAYIIVVLGLMFYCKKRRNAKRLQKGQEGEEPEMECLNGGTVQHNGHTTAEIQEEVALTNMGTTATTEKRHSHGNNDKLQFPRADLHTITTLGKGEFGEVLLAKANGIEEGEEETVVLVKSLQTRDEQLQLDFRREAEMFAKLSHSNVVRLLGMCRDAEPHYTILEYYDLGDVKQFLRISKSKDEKISTKTKVSICAQVAQGMEHLSNHRFVHKDLAARNCLISGQRHVKVSALSLSKDVYNSEYFHYRQAWIPLRWLPTESVFEDDFSTKSDVWAFGVLVWEVFSHGDLPYAKLSDDEVLEGLQAGKLKLPVPDGCPSKVYKLMVRCWAPSPKERPSFSEIVHTLGELPSDSKV
ncbi:inactive tyrosine-protein kinase 7 [Aplochiton taeniatus]